ncbi:CPXCG motif-containing cysteine-rich protein [Bizionia sediminis]|uniref:CPXCG motif-containing cysteine-rich protein n=1 Tax=Bizionia sediminis TaxID=1737064 RepID=A0ABW5KV99_9FLAO
MDEHTFQCPYCWETVSMLLDSSISEQQYIEDCEVCCNPIEITVHFDDQVLVGFQAESIEQ